MENRIVTVISIIVIAGLLGGAYYYQTHRDDTPVSPPKTEAPVVEAPAKEPEIKYPLPASETENTKPLPVLDDSDAAVQQALGELIDKDSVKRFFEANTLVRRVVVTVDNLPRKKIPQQYSLTQPLPGKYIIAGKGDTLAMNAANIQRYTLYIRLVEAIDTKKLAAAYRRFYPLFQEEYRNIGSSKQYFNDRVVEAIDDLLAAPELKGAIKLVQPKVFYQFADPALEDLSAGQKIMLRMGPENAARMKAKLKDIRRELTSGGQPKEVR